MSSVLDLDNFFNFTLNDKKSNKKKSVYKFKQYILNATFHVYGKLLNLHLFQTLQRITPTTRIFSFKPLLDGLKMIGSSIFASPDIVRHSLI